MGYFSHAIIFAILIGLLPLYSDPLDKEQLLQEVCFNL